MPVHYAEIGLHFCVFAFNKMWCVNKLNVCPDACTV